MCQNPPNICIWTNNGSTEHSFPLTEISPGKLALSSPNSYHGLYASLGKHISEKNPNNKNQTILIDLPGTDRPELQITDNQITVNYDEQILGTPNKQNPQNNNQSKLYNKAKQGYNQASLENLYNCQPLATRDQLKMNLVEGAANLNSDSKQLKKFLKVFYKADENNLKDCQIEVSKPQNLFFSNLKKAIQKPEPKKQFEVTSPVQITNINKQSAVVKKSVNKEETRIIGEVKSEQDNLADIEYELTKLSNSHLRNLCDKIVKAYDKVTTPQKMINKSKPYSQIFVSKTIEKKAVVPEVKKNIMLKENKKETLEFESKEKTIGRDHKELNWLPANEPNGVRILDSSTENVTSNETEPGKYNRHESQESAIKIDCLENVLDNADKFVKMAEAIVLEQKEDLPISVVTSAEKTNPVSKVGMDSSVKSKKSVDSKSLINIMKSPASDNKLASSGRNNPRKNVVKKSFLKAKQPVVSEQPGEVVHQKNAEVVLSGVEVEIIDNTDKVVWEIDAKQVNQDFGKNNIEENCNEIIANLDIEKQIVEGISDKTNKMIQSVSVNNLELEDEMRDFVLPQKERQDKSPLSSKRSVFTKKSENSNNVIVIANNNTIVVDSNYNDLKQEHGVAIFAPNSPVKATPQKEQKNIMATPKNSNQEKNDMNLLLPCECFCIFFILLCLIKHPNSDRYDHTQKSKQTKN